MMPPCWNHAATPLCSIILAISASLIILVFSHDPFVVNGQTPYLAEAMVVQIIIFMIQSVALNTLGLYQAGRGKLAARDTLAVMLRMPLLYVLAASLLARNVGWDAENFFLWPIMGMASKALLLGHGQHRCPAVTDEDPLAR
mgnify:CR=1 FL=1